ncbi:MAG: hypothetical protein WAU04_06985, partial [Candidatus Nitrotoga sp.]
LGGTGVDADWDKTPGCAVVDNSGAVVWHAIKAMPTATSCKDDNKEMDFIYNAFFWRMREYRSIRCRIIGRVTRQITLCISLCIPQGNQKSALDRFP